MLRLSRVQTKQLGTQGNLTSYAENLLALF